MHCEKCKGNRYCSKKGEFARRLFFAMGRGEVVTCLDFEERWYRGIEGVAA